jgi:MFS family permease
MEKSPLTELRGIKVSPQAQARVAEGNAVEARRRFNLGTTFAALKYPNYRLWFMGQLGSIIGTWMQATAEGFLVFELTHSPAYLGYVGFAAGIPSWFFMLIGGVVADRFPRRTLILITQTTMMLLAFTSATLTFTHLIQPWHIVVLAFFLGIANAFDAPARQAFVLEMVEREDLGNAIALNSTMFQMATVIGPSAAGVTYALVGPAWCFTVNGISFLAVITALLRMNIKPLPVKTQTRSALSELTEGLRYVTAHVYIRTIVGIVVATSLFGLAFATLIPAWSVTILHGDATTNGLLQSARGIGALGGALVIASLGRFRWKGKLLTVGSFVFPISLLVFANISNVVLALLVLILVGWGFMVLFNLANILIQQMVDDALRGRVMAIYSLTFFGFMPLGALGAGVVAEHFGEPFTVMLGATISLLVALFVYWRLPQIRALQ